MAAPRRRNGTGSGGRATLPCAGIIRTGTKGLISPVRMFGTGPLASWQRYAKPSERASRKVYNDPPVSGRTRPSAKLARPAPADPDTSSGNFPFNDDEVI